MICSVASTQTRFLPAPGGLEPLAHHEAGQRLIMIDARYLDRLHAPEPPMLLTRP